MEKLIALKHKLDAIKTMGTNAKKEALANLDEFEQSMVSLMLNPFIRFGVKKYKVAEPLDTSVPSDQKVVELLEKLVDNTDFATGVYDPFGGSGTTLAACEAYGQPSYIMELTPAFTDVIVKRYIRITGKTTVRCVRQGRELPREEIAAIFEPDEEGGEQE